MTNPADPMRQFLDQVCAALDSKDPARHWPRWPRVAASQTLVAAGVAVSVAGCSPGTKYAGPPPHPDPGMPAVETTTSPPDPGSSGSADDQDPPASFPGAGEQPSDEPPPADGAEPPEPPDMVVKYGVPPPEAAPRYGVPIEPQPIDPPAVDPAPGRKYGAPPPPGGVEALYAVPF